MAFRTSNPALKESTFTNAGYRTSVYSASESMTLNGTLHRTFFLLCLAVGAGSITWGLAFTQPDLVIPIMILGLVGGFITALVTIFKQASAPISAPIYAIFEGLALGGISAMYNSTMPGIVVSAFALTAAVLFTLIALYRTGVVRATASFRAGLLASMGAIIFVSFGALMLSFFGVNVSAITGSGPIALGFCLFATVIAALNLVLDFDLIERGVEGGAPKYMEWYAAFGVLMTLVWLYLEMLRLLSILNRRD